MRKNGRHGILRYGSCVCAGPGQERTYVRTRGTSSGEVGNSGVAKEKLVQRFRCRSVAAHTNWSWSWLLLVEVQLACDALAGHHMEAAGGQAPVGRRQFM